MAHKLDFSKGKAAFISYAQPGWHKLGKVFETEITTAAALDEAGLNFTVLKLPNIHILPDMNEIVSNDSFFTCRTDVNKILGSRLGRDYTVLQNVEALNIVDEILQSGRAKIETAGAIDEGRKVFICLKVDQSIIVGSSDEVKQYVLITTSHDGSMSITATPTNIRVVCNNTLTAALKDATGAVKIRHTSNGANRLKEAMKVLNLITENTQVNTDNYNAMQSNIITPAQMFNYFGSVFFSPEEIKNLQKGNDMKQAGISTQKQNTLAKVLNFAQNGQGQAQTLINNNLTMWSAYNAITGVITRKEYKNENDRANSMLFGSAAATIHEAGILALEPAKIQTLAKINLTGINFN